jgi:hypothetical protein
MTNQLSFDKIEFVTYGTYDTFPGKLNPIAAAIRGESEMGGGGLGKVLGVVVAIAVPFVAPYVASAVFGASVMAGAVTGTLAAAATGAVLGGVGAALTGGDWRKGALFGGLGGGLTQGMGGFGSTNNPVFGQATTQNAGWFGPTGSAIYGQGSSSAVAQGANVVDDAATAVANNADTVAQGQTITPQANSAASNTLSSGNNQAAMSYAGNNVAGNSGQVLTSGGGGSGLNINYAGGTNNLGTGTLTPGADSVLRGGNIDYSLTSGMNTGGPGLRLGNVNTSGLTLNANAAPKSFTGELAARFTDPKRMADMAVLATPNLIGQLYSMQAGKEQQKQIEKYQAELKALEGKDQAAYELKLKEAQEYIANAKNINPNYWGQMSANQANISGARRLAEAYRDTPMAGLRDLSGDRRRDMIGLSQNVGTAYNQGYITGQGMRDQAVRTGYSMLPNAPRTGLEGQRQIAGMYADLDNSRAAAAQGVSQTATYFTYPFLSRYQT